MKIALFHNYYKLRGGEDVMFELECSALREAGHEVVTFILRNEEEIRSGSPLATASVAVRLADNHHSYKRVREFIARERPDISHVHNWFPLFSPSIYRAHADAKVPVVQTLHNYRLGCAAGTFFRKGNVCDSCMPLKTNSAVAYKCYRGSLIGSLAWKRMADQNWSDGTFRNKVDQYICPTEMVRQRHIEMGLRPETIATLPNACADPLDVLESRPFETRKAITYVGRLVREKGVGVLLEAWRALELEGVDLPELRIIGSGPDGDRLQSAYGDMASVSFLGQLPREEVMGNMLDSRLLVFPSLSPEIFGLGIIEAMAAGCPVLASKLGGPAELFEDGVEGVYVEAGDATGLGEKLAGLLGNPEELAVMGTAARALYEKKYSTRQHAKSLVDLFKRVMEAR
ncbi:MAG: glycosyltransferase family 4 protein [Puniceicoccaceae bacterium]